MDRLKNRRGVTLVLMAFMLTVLIGSAAFAVDFGRLYLYRTQLNTATDAAALAGIYQVLHKQPLPDSAVSQAKYFAARHLVGPDSVLVSDGDVVPGTWTQAGGFVPSTWTDPGLDAVQVTARYTGTYGFGKVLGLNTHVVSAMSQAVMGYVGFTTCVRPVAIPYQSLLNQLYPPDPVTGNPTMGVDHNLTDADVAALQSAGPAMSVSLKLGSSSTSGNFYILQMGPYAHADQVPLSPGPNYGGDPIFTQRFGGDCSNSPWSVGPGDWLEGKQGNAAGPTESGFDQLCGTTTSGNGTFPCTAPLEERQIKVAMWATEDDGVCSPRCFQVKLVGVFVVTAFTKTSTGDDGISGYFSSIPSSGSFSTIPTPIRKIGLVK